MPCLNTWQTQSKLKSTTINFKIDTSNFQQNKEKRQLPVSMNKKTTSNDDLMIYYYLENKKFRDDLELLDLNKLMEELNNYKKQENSEEKIRQNIFENYSQKTLISFDNDFEEYVKEYMDMLPDREEDENIFNDDYAGSSSKKEDLLFNLDTDLENKEKYDIMFKEGLEKFEDDLKRKNDKVNLASLNIDIDTEDLNTIPSRFPQSNSNNNTQRNEEELIMILEKEEEDSSFYEKRKTSNVRSMKKEIKRSSSTDNIIEFID